MTNWLLRIAACKGRRLSWLKVECVCWGIHWAQVPIELEDMYKAFMLLMLAWYTTQ